MKRPVLAVLAAGAVLGLSCRGAEPKTAEEKKAKGDQILRQMSDTLAGTKTFSFTSEEVSDKVGAGGQKTQGHLTRYIVVRRPDAVTFRVEGDRSTTAWYDGKTLTMAADKLKVWARGPVPPTLDETMDYVAAVYDLKLPWGDLLYSSPYDALMTADTSGGWVGVETIEGKEYDHLSYQHPVVDWQIWIGREHHRPKQVQITYKQDAGQPVTTVTFKDWNPAPTVDENTFSAKVPEGYTRIRLVRRDSDLAPVEMADTTAAPASPAVPPAPPRR